MAETHTISMLPPVLLLAVWAAGSAHASASSSLEEAARAMPDREPALMELREKALDRLVAGLRFNEEAPRDTADGVTGAGPFSPTVVFIEQGALMETIAHEWAHVMNWCVGGIFARAAASTFHRDLRSRGGEFPTPYASTNGAEYFADAATVWLGVTTNCSPGDRNLACDPDALRRTDPRMALMLEKFFGPPRPPDWLAPR